MVKKVSTNVVIVYSLQFFTFTSFDLMWSLAGNREKPYVTPIYHICHSASFRCIDIHNMSQLEGILNTYLNDMIRRECRLAS